MGWFKRKSKEEAGDRSFDAVAERIAGWILKWQTSLSAKLNAKAKKYDSKTILLVMAGLGLLFGGYCLWLVSSLFR
ncbi:hypothetical protein GM921_09710 [Pedobacter sp. LMG 31464]|uniref:Uncharacterized protein n=1 Tax=Pedobacter planticolens TaxID=2679964 RepID=A0A923E1I3_9SPHI|nr:hypothetical protein [Pedobacter planticolens]MBB2145762.1 hypothetical protein [Pedobacter planticolens]